jgi:tetratricopeptide (TPR) repeat protein
MPRTHPKPEILSGLLELLPEARSRLLRHVHACPSCRAALAARAPAEPGGLLFWRPSEMTAGQAVDRVLTALLPRIQAAARERDEAPALLAELLSHRPERRELLVRNSKRFRNLPLCGLLLQRSYRDSVDAPREGERLARVALKLAESLDPSAYGERVLADARGRCWMTVGNARRLASDLRGSEEAFRQAEAELNQGTGDLLEKAQFLAYRACLWRAQRRLDEAAGLFRRAVSVFLWAGEPRRAAESIVGLALVEQYRGEPEQAIHTLEQADALTDPGEDPFFYYFVRFRRIECLAGSGRPLEAQALLAGSPEMYGFPDEILQLRLRWLEARIALAQGDLRRGAGLLDEVRKELVGRGSAYDAAVASLELALVHARLGRFGSTERLADQARRLFQGLGIARESLAASLVLWQAGNRSRRRARRAA